MCARVFECVGVFGWIGVAYPSKKALSWCVYMCIWVCICVCGCERVCVWVRVFFGVSIEEVVGVYMFMHTCARVCEFVRICVHVFVNVRVWLGGWVS